MIPTIPSTTRSICWWHSSRSMWPTFWTRAGWRLSLFWYSVCIWPVPVSDWRRSRKDWSVASCPRPIPTPLSSSIGRTTTIANSPIEFRWVKCSLIPRRILTDAFSPLPTGHHHRRLQFLRSPGANASGGADTNTGEHLVHHIPDLHRILAEIVHLVRRSQ